MPQAAGRPSAIPQSRKSNLLSKAALGYLTHQKKPVLGVKDGDPVKLCEGFRDRGRRSRSHVALQDGHGLPAHGPAQAIRCCAV
ncbi:putative resolvase, N domain-containing protein [Streptomyces sp. Tu6071]|nr:putative resolvase, N domain-containing protein [Streptomyces sp. Tu6071]